MPTSFEDMDIALAAEPHLAAHGELAITYVSTVHGTLSIDALVERGPLSPKPTDPTSRPEYEYVIGIPKADVPTINIKGDTVAIATRTDGGTTMSQRTIKNLIHQDGAFWWVGL